MSLDVEHAVQGIAQGKPRSFYLIVGDEFLARGATDAIVEALLGPNGSGGERVTLQTASPAEIFRELATVSMFGSRKVVVAPDPDFVAPKTVRGNAFGKVTQAWRADRRAEAVRRMLALIGRVGWNRDSLDPDSDDFPRATAWERELGIALDTATRSLLRELHAHALEHGLTGETGDDATLQRLLGELDPERAILLMHCAEVDASWAAVAKKCGVRVEVASPTRLKDLDLSELAAKALKPYGAKLAPGALEALKERVGANFRLAESELVKLAQHVGTGSIRVDDVTALVAHVREDEYFELSDAIHKRDLAAALKYWGDAKALGKEALMVLGALAGLVRKLLSTQDQGRQILGGQIPKNFQEFQRTAFPKIQAEAIAAKVKPPHPYASFNALLASSRFRRGELIAALTLCADADLALKLGGDSLVIERLLWTLCGSARGWDARMHVIRREQER